MLPLCRHWCVHEALEEASLAESVILPDVASSCCPRWTEVTVQELLQEHGFSLTGEFSLKDLAEDMNIIYGHKDITIKILSSYASLRALTRNAQFGAYD